MISKKNQNKFLLEYRNFLLCSPDDDILIDFYENSKTHFVRLKSGDLKIGKRKSYQKVVNEYIKELKNNFFEYIDSTVETLEKIDNVVNNNINDFNVFNNDKKEKLIQSLVENSWIEKEFIVIK